MVSIPERKPRVSSDTLLFAGIVAAFCVWLLSLPLFPTQDGPMHRYYIHILDSLLHHGSGYGMYRIRHPFPPYATHYLLLLLLSKLFAYDLAEKLFVCFCIVAFAYGLRLCATVAGPSGRWVSLMAAPLFLPWALMMGFFNFYLGTALFLFAAAFWQLASEQSPRFWLAFAGTVFVLTFTHPVPLLLLLAVCGLDLVVGGLLRHRLSIRTWFPADRWRFAGFALLCAAFLVPASLVSRQGAHSTFADFGLHLPFVRTSVLLMGVSPYNTRSLNLFINLYRLSLYTVLLVSLVLAVQAARHLWRERVWNLSATFFLCTAALAVSLPFLPDTLNGGVYFATRILPMVWVGLLITASAARVPLSRTYAIAFTSFAVALAFLTLIPAELFLRPVANDLKAAELASVPEKARGVLLVGYGLHEYVRFQKQLSFDPYYWGASLAAVGRDDVLLDAPWMNLNIIPVEAVRPGPLIVGGLDDAHTVRSDSPHFGHSLPVDEESQLVGASEFILFSGTPEEMERGLRVQLESAEAARFHCSRAGWHLLCLAGPTS